MSPPTAVPGGSEDISAETLLPVLFRLHRRRGRGRVPTHATPCTCVRARVCVCVSGLTPSSEMGGPLCCRLCEHRDACVCARGPTVCTPTSMWVCVRTPGWPGYAFGWGTKTDPARRYDSGRTGVTRDCTRRGHFTPGVGDRRAKSGRVGQALLPRTGTGRDRRNRRGTVERGSGPGTSVALPGSTGGPTFGVGGDGPRLPRDPSAGEGPYLHPTFWVGGRPTLVVIGRVG